MNIMTFIDTASGVMLEAKHVKPGRRPWTLVRLDTRAQTDPDFVPGSVVGTDLSFYEVVDFAKRWHNESLLTAGHVASAERPHWAASRFVHGDRVRHNNGRVGVIWNAEVGTLAIGVRWDTVLYKEGSADTCMADDLEVHE